MEDHGANRNKRSGGANQTSNEASGGTFHGPVIMSGQVQLGLLQKEVRVGTRLGAHDQMYSGGEWVDLPYEPVPDAGTGDLADDYVAAGFSPWISTYGSGYDTRYMHSSYGNIPLSLVVYERDTRVPRFAIELTGNMYGSTLITYAATLPDLMELLAKWSPTLKLLAETAQLTRTPQRTQSNPPPKKGSSAT